MTQNNKKQHALVTKKRAEILGISVEKFIALNMRNVEKL